MNELENAINVEVLVIAPEPGVVSNVRNMLHSNGFRNINAGKTLRQFKEQVERTSPDVIICSAEFPRGNSCDLIHQIRLGDLGKNPFVPVIILTAKPSNEFVREILSSGPDALVIMPFSTQQLMDKIYGLVYSRKQFVATSDYLGPDRRPDSREPGAHEIAKFDVPNSFRTKVSGDVAPMGNGQSVDDLMSEMILYRLNRQSDQMNLLVDRIMQARDDGDWDHSECPSFKSLQHVAKDTLLRMSGTPYAHVSDLCKSLLRVADTIPACAGDALEKNIQLMSRLSQAVQLGFTKTHTDAATREISQTLCNG